MVLYTVSWGRCDDYRVLGVLSVPEGLNLGALWDEFKVQLPEERRYWVSRNTYDLWVAWMANRHAVAHAPLVGEFNFVWHEESCRAK